MTSVSVALTLLLVGVAALVAAFFESRAAQSALEHRIDLVRPKRLEYIRHDVAAEALKRIDGVLLKFFSLGFKGQAALSTNGVYLLGLAIASLAAIWGIICGVLGAPAWVGAMAGATAFIVAPWLRLRAAQEEIERQFIEVFPDAIEMIVRMLRAGLPFVAAIRMVARDGAYPVNHVFGDISNQMDIGVPFEDALRATAERIHLGDFRYFSVAASLQRTTGGNLAETLKSLSDVIRKKRAMRLRAKAVTAEVRMTAYILGAMPFFIVGALLLTQPDYLQPLANDPRGNVIAVAAFSLLMLAFIVIRSMMRSVTRVS